MQKRGLVEDKIVLVILGLVAILLLGLLIRAGYDVYANNKSVPSLFDENGFVPYTPSYSAEEMTVLYSTQALRCSLNLVAKGSFDPTLCPEDPVKPTKVDAASQVVQYGQAKVLCTGAAPSSVPLASQNKQEAVAKVGKAILDCWQQNSVLHQNKDMRCAFLDTAGAQEITKQDLLDFFESYKQTSEGKAYAGAIDELTGWKFDRVAANGARLVGKAAGGVGQALVYALDRLGNSLWWLGYKIVGSDYQFQDSTADVIPIPDLKSNDLLDIAHDKLSSITVCVDYASSYGMSDWRRWRISLNDCNTEAQAGFSCSLEGFELPQKDVSNWIPAVGDPKWLVYYEAFPEEAAVYWHKEWKDVFNLYSVGMVTTSGVLNLGFGGKAAGEIEKAALKETATEVRGGIFKKLFGKLTQRTLDAGAQEVVERFATKGYENTMRSLLLEDVLKNQLGMKQEVASKIGKEILEVMGKESGTETFAAGKQEIKKRVTKVIAEEYGAGMRTVLEDQLTKAGKTSISKTATIEELQGTLAETLIEGQTLKTTIGKTEVKGIQGFFDTAVSKQFLDPKAMKSVLKQREYEQFLKSFILPSGLLDEELLKNSGEKAVAQLKNIAAKDPSLFREALESVRKPIDVLLQGAVRTDSQQLGKNFLTANPAVWARGVHELVQKNVLQYLPGTKTFVATTACVGLTWDGALRLDSPCWLILGVQGLRWAKDHPTIGALVLAWMIEAEDSINEKFKPVGTNALAINTPSLLGETKTLELAQEALPYFIRNSLKPSSRLYFVSPCKARMQVVQRTCECVNNPLFPQYSWGKGTIDVKPGTVKLKDYGILTEQFKTDWLKLSDADRAGFGNEFENYAVARKKQLESINENAINNPLGGDVSPFVAQFKNSFDDSYAVKECEQPETMRSLLNDGSEVYQEHLRLHGLAVPKNPDLLYGKEMSYKPQCLEVQPTVEEGYCYDNFPNTGYVRTAISVAGMATSVYVSAQTGGLAAPFAMFGIGAATEAIDLALESSEKWP